jgi:hypothetical protein
MMAKPRLAGRARFGGTAMMHRPLPPLAAPAAGILGHCGDPAPLAGPEIPLHCGYGACSKCSCVGFNADTSNNNVCQRCGHSYGEHW